MTVAAATAVPPIGATIGYVSSHLPGLVPAERRVAEVLVREPEFVSQASAADVAARAGTSAATVVRTCKTLGLIGFQNVRMLLVRDLAAAGSDAEDQPTGSVMERMAGHAVRDLPAAISTLDEAELVTVARAVASAGRLLLVGNGASAPPVQIAALLMAQHGRSVEAPVEAVLQHMTAVGLSPGDVCLAVSNSGTNTVTLDVVEAARASGATIVALTGYARSRLCEDGAHALIAGPPVRDGVEGLPTIVATQVLVLTALAEFVADIKGARPGFATEVFHFIAEGDVPEGGAHDGGERKP